MVWIYRSLSRVRAIAISLIIAVGSFGYGIFAATTTESDTSRIVSVLVGLLSLTVGVGCLSLMIHKHSMQKADNVDYNKKLQSELMHRIIGLDKLTRDMQSTFTHSLGVINRSVIKNSDHARIHGESLREHLLRSNSSISETNTLIANSNLEIMRSISLMNRSLSSSSKILDGKIIEFMSDISAIEKNIETEQNQVLKWRDETQKSMGVTNRSIVDLRKSNESSMGALVGELQQLLEATETRQLILLQEMYRSLNLPEEFEVPVEMNHES